jgi:hypothetical protein
MTTGGAAAAQDLPTTQMSDHAQVLRQDTLTRSLLRQRQAQRNAVGPDGLDENSRAVCRNKGEGAAKLGRDHPLVDRLYRACAKAGL